MNALSNLKNHAVVFVAVLAIGLSTSASHAQSQTDRVQFRTPFAFEYQSRVLPAGRYVVSRQYPRILLITDGPHSAMGLAQPTEDREPTTKGKIVFRKYGQRYFLSQVWVAGNSTHFEISRSKAEKRVEKEAKIAMNGAAPSTVEMALLETPR